MDFIPDRYEAAIRWEQARARIRLLRDSGKTITKADFEEAQAAREDYDLATALLR